MGVIMYILLCGYPPFYPTVGNDLTPGMRKKIKAGEYQFHGDGWAQVSEDAKSIVKRMLTVNPVERITIREIINCSWLDGLISERIIDVSALSDNENRNEIQVSSY